MGVDIVGLLDEIDRLLKVKTLRSADRANLIRIRDRVKHGEPIRPYDEQVVWSYVSRYLGPVGQGVPYQ